MSDTYSNAAKKRKRTTELLSEIAEQSHTDSILLSEIIDQFGVRAFGVLIVLGTLPAFLPTPVGAGALAAPMTIIVGIQMVLMFTKPWLPKWLREKGFQRAGIQRFILRIKPWILPVEKLCKPRWTALFNPWVAGVTGLLLIGQAIALALPIPLTNYPFALVMILTGIALIEDDGLMLSISWTLMATTIGAIIGFSHTMVAYLEIWFGWML